MRTKLAAVILAGLAWAGAANAATMTLSYHFAPGRTTSLTLDGARSADGALFEVAHVTGIAVDGVPLPARPIAVASYDTHTSMVPGLSPTVRMDGSAADLWVAMGADTLELAVANTYAGVNSDEAQATRGLGGDGAPHPFTRADLTIQPAR